MSSNPGGNHQLHEWLTVLPAGPERENRGNTRMGPSPDPDLLPVRLFRSREEMSVVCWPGSEPLVEGVERRDHVPGSRLGNR